MAASSRPPFRADHVGSLLRPTELHAARAKAEAKQISAAQLREVEDRSIREAVTLQESAGLQGITDGELRRAFWHVDFLTGFEGITPTHSDYAVTFKGDGGATADTHSMLVVSGKIRRRKPIMVDPFVFLRSVTKRTAKLCIPSPTYLHMRGGRKIVDAQAYPKMEGFWADITKAYREEIADLVAAGCTYLQLDDVSFSYLCDDTIREQIKRDGEDPKKLPQQYVNAINAIIADRPAALSVTIHTCRGNFQSMWMASGSYDAVAEAFFGSAAVDGFFLEYDSDRAGGFEPLRFVPKGKRVVLGLVSTKSPEIESKDALKRRIEGAAKFIPLDSLCLSPQCGFASTHHGNRITPEIQRRKLALVVEVATEVWGSF